MATSVKSRIPCCRSMASVIFALLLLATASAFAQSIGEKTGVNAMLDKPPTGSDVLLGLHQFNLFQQEVADSADKRGDAAIRKFIKAQSGAAEKRDDLIGALKKKTGMEINFPEEPSVGRSNRLGGLEGSVADAYARGFYKAETAEHESAVSLLKRYIAKPDNADIRAFAEQQLPMLESDLKQVQELGSR